MTVPPDLADQRPRGHDVVAYDRRARRFLFAAVLVQLIYLAWPIHALVEHMHGPSRVGPVAAALAFTVCVYVWSAWRAVFGADARPAWAAAAALFVLGMTLPFFYGPFVLGFQFYAAVLLGVTLPLVPGAVAVLVLAVATAAVGMAVPSSPFIAISLLTALVGAVFLAASRLLSTNRELLASRGEVERLATEGERLRLARDLHDAVKQQVFVAAMEIGAARTLLDGGQAAAEGHLAEADRAVRAAQRELGGVIEDMRRPALAGRTLAEALREHVAAWSRRHGIGADLRVLDGQTAAPEASDALFRAAQEALANAARHSGARAVRVTLAGDGAALTLSVSDDGRGFDPPDVPPGQGLAGMRERLAAVGGSVTVDSSPGAGTRVTCVCPSTSGGPR
ncbi:MAG: sensor histidine kinase [Streptosporangiaceae bacterium]